MILDGINFRLGRLLRVIDFDMGHCIGVLIGRRAFRFRLPFGMSCRASARAYARRHPQN